MKLTREALESKLLQEISAHPELNLKILSDRELLTSIRETLKQKTTEEIWIFAYGSLIWNPLFEYTERRVIKIEGWQRKFCLLAPVWRGTVENPGLVLGLEKGGSCQGIAYRLAVDLDLESELLLLWRREMLVESYIPSWIKVKDKDKEIEVLAFIVNQKHQVYVNNLSKENIVHSLATAKGALGSSAEYLNQTVKGLLAEGIEDKQLIELNYLVKKQKMSK